jgi:hypothetical protein
MGDGRSGFRFWTRPFPILKRLVPGLHGNKNPASALPLVPKYDLVLNQEFHRPRFGEIKKRSVVL